jgi:hypothetical protein
MGFDTFPRGWVRGVRGGDNSASVIVCGDGGRSRK